MIGDDEIKPGSKLTEYQKRIAATENVILCVAAAEEMVHAIGQSLLSEHRANPEADQDSRAEHQDG